MHGKQILLFNKKNIINISGEKGIRTILQYKKQDNLILSWFYMIDYSTEIL